MTQISDYTTVLTESVQSGQVLVATLNRPAVGNALNTQMARDLLDLWTRLTEDAGSLRCVVLTGAGDRIFCGGGDLKERNGMTVEAWQRQHEIFERQYWALVDLPLPVIASVNGHAYAGGLEMALCCDFIYASVAARFAFTEVTLGIMPGAGGTQNLPRAIGERRAKELIMTGRAFTCSDALEWGLVNKACESGTVLAQALDVASLVVGNAPLAVRQAKKAIATAARWNCARPTVSKSRRTTTSSTPRTGSRACRPSMRSAGRCSRAADPAIA